MYVKWCHKIQDEDIAQFGHKGTLLVQLHNDGFPVPLGFMVSTKAFSDFLLETDVGEFIKAQLAHIKDDASNLQDIANSIQKKIVDSEVPQDILLEVLDSYDDFDSVHSELKSTMESLGLTGTVESPVTIKTSIVTKQGISKPPQNATLLNARGEGEITRGLKTCWASAFTLDNMKFRLDHKLSLADFEPAVMIQQMVYPQKSGLIHTTNNATYTILAALGLSEAITSGGVDPDKYTVDRDSGAFKQIHIQPQMWKYSVDRSMGKIIREELSSRDRDMQVLSKEEAQVLTRMARKISAGFSEPLEIEWCLEKNKAKVMNVKSLAGTQLILHPEEIKEEVDENKPSSAIIVHRKKEVVADTVVAPPLAQEPMQYVGPTTASHQEENQEPSINHGTSTTELPLTQATENQSFQQESVENKEEEKLEESHDNDEYRTAEDPLEKVSQNVQAQKIKHHPARLPITPEEEKTIALIANATLGSGAVDRTVVTDSTTLLEEVENESLNNGEPEESNSNELSLESNELEKKELDYSEPLDKETVEVLENKIEDSNPSNYPEATQLADVQEEPSAQELLDNVPPTAVEEEVAQEIPIDFEEDTLTEKQEDTTATETQNNDFEQPSVFEEEAPLENDSIELHSVDEEAPKTNLSTEEPTPELQQLEQDSEQEDDELDNDEEDDTWLDEEDDSELDDDDDDSFLEDSEKDLQTDETPEPFIKTMEPESNLSTEDILMCTAKIEAALNTCHLNLFGSVPDLPFFSLLEKLKTKQEMPFEDDIKRIRMIKGRAENGNVTTEDHSFVTQQTEEIVDSLCKPL